MAELSSVPRTPVATRTGAPFRLVLRREPGGPAVATEPVEPSDLVDAIAEVWFETLLRRGRWQHALGEVSAQLRLVYRQHAEAGRYCAGFELESRAASGEPTRHFFARETLEHVAARRARLLLEDGTLQAGDLYYYAPDDGDREATLHGPAGCVRPTALRLPLRALRARVRETRGSSEGGYPVFYTAHALERAERISRKGADSQPPVETGGLLVGPLCSCPDSGEAFSVVVDVIEATGSEATTYSLSYSGESWARIQTVLRARQANPGTRHQRILGQAHGHNFQPLAGAAPCEACEWLPVCTRTSAILSPDDRVWCRAVFHAQPWQLSHVFGLDARSRRVDAFYGQRGGWLVPRGYQVVDSVDDLFEKGD